MNPMIKNCPVCGTELTTTRLHCDNCDTTIEGNFSGSSSPFAGLSPDQIQFVLTFIRCEGRINRMEDELNLSYPTIRNRLYEVIRALGYEPGKEETPARLTADERRRILDDLDLGKLTPEQAQRMLQGFES